MSSSEAPGGQPPVNQPAGGRATSPTQDHPASPATGQPPEYGPGPRAQAQAGESGHAEQGAEAEGKSKIPPPQRIKIGSQRPSSPPIKTQPAKGVQPAPPAGTEPAPPTEQAAELPPRETAAAGGQEHHAAASPAPEEAKRHGGQRRRQRREETGAEQAAAPQQRKFPVPNIRHQLPLELELEVAEALGGMSLEEVLDPASAPLAQELQADARMQARVVSVHRDNVFVALGGRDQGVLSLRQFAEPPAAGAVVDVVVGRFDPEEGLYQLTLPGAPSDVGDWSELSEGMLVEARITGHNKGGLECEVNRLRGFIPASQVSTWRVEDLSQLVGEKMNCIVTEANAEKRNLVLSRRAALERENAEAKTRLMAELSEGQVREGVVRSLQDYGAFIDLGGVDGLLHVSQLAWQRVKHPSEVLQVGQTIKVKIRKIDEETGKLSLSFRDLVENPWTTAAQRYPVTSTVHGTVTRIMEFGAFVEIEPGVEGLVHISELAHGRVWRTSDIVQEGQEVEAKVLSVDAEQQRIGLSMKALMARAEPAKKKDEPQVDEAPPPSTVPKRTGPLKGGTGRSSGGDQFGLKW